jgi:heat shock protein HslJ
VNDSDLERKIGVALRERFPVPTHVDLLSGLDRPAKPTSSRIRVVLAVATCVVTVAALSIALALHASTKSRPAAAAGRLIGITWRGSGGTLVFTDHTVRIFDGCTNHERQVTIGAGVLDLGTYFGSSSDCLGPEVVGPKPVRVGDFDKVMAGNHLTWRRTGDTLRLTDDDGETMQMRANGPALYLTGQTWTLKSYVDFRGSEHDGDRSVQLRIDDGTVRATDLCNEMTGTATVTDSTITFVVTHSTDRACPDTTLSPETQEIDRTLSGTVNYMIQGDELTLSGRVHGLLVYTPHR